MSSRTGLPNGWCWAPLDHLGLAVTGSTPPKSDAGNFGGPIPFIKPTDLNAGYNVWDATDSLTEMGAEKGRMLPANTVLVTCIGATIGKTGLARVPCATNQQINAVVTDADIDRAKWLYWGLVSPWGQQQIRSNASATTLPILNKGKFERTELPVAPHAEQRRIVAKIEELFSYLDAAVAALERAKANLKRYRAAVLKAAVEGKLTKQWRAEHPDGLPAPRPNVWHVYAIECYDDSIYVGHTDNLPRRWQEHREGKGAQWTRTHRPRYVIHWEEFPSRKEAAAREKWLKTGFGRKWLKRERAAGRTRQAGEPASELLKRILAERRKKWEQDQLAKYESKGKKPPKGWKDRYREPPQPDTSDLPALPAGWCWATIDALT